MGRTSACLLSCSLLLAGCGQSGKGPLRSPSLDYSSPAPTTADGRTVGADGVGPGDKLHQGVTNQGPAPGWDISKKDGLTADPKQRVGGAVDPPPTNGSSQSK